MTSSVAAFFGATDRDTAPAVLLIHLNIVCYAFCFWTQRPVIPFITKGLGADAVLFGNFQSAMSVMALVGGPIMGNTVDSQGAKFGLIVSQAGSAIMYTTTFFATSLPILFFSAFFSVVQHAMMCAQAAMTQVTSDENRANAMGKLSLSYGIGMILGSSLGGFISERYGHYTPALIAATMSLLMVVVNVIHLPPLKSVPKSGGQASSVSFRAIWETLWIPAVRDIIVVLTLVGLGTSCLKSMFAVMAQEVFDLTAQDLGFFMSFVALIGVVANVGGVGIATQRLGDYRSIVASTIVVALCYVGYSASRSYSEFLVLTVPSTICTSILYTVLNALISKAVGSSHAGTAISLSHAARSLTGIVSPMLGGHIYQSYGKQGIGLFGGAVVLLAGVFVLVEGKHFKVAGGDKKNQ